MAGAAWNAWVFIPAAVAAVFAIVDAFLVVLGAKAERTEEWMGLLRRRPCRAGDVEARECHVDRAVLPEGQEWRYVERDFEDELRDAIKGALSAEGPRLVILSGPTKAGKTRAAFQALDWEELRGALAARAARRSERQGAARNRAGCRVGTRRSSSGLTTLRGTHRSMRVAFTPTL